MARCSAGVSIVREPLMYIPGRLLAEPLLPQPHDSLVIIPDPMRTGWSAALAEDLLAQSDIDVLVTSADELADWRAGKLARRFPGRVKVFNCPDPDDCGRVVRWAFRYAASAGYRTAFLTDPALGPDADQLSAMRQALERSDVVVASRGPGGGLWGGGGANAVVRRLVTAAACALAGLPEVDLTSGCKGFSRQAFESMRWHRFEREPLAVQVELTCSCVRCGFRIAEVPARFRGEPAPGGHGWAGVARLLRLLPGLAAGRSWPELPPQGAHGGIG